MEQIQNKKQEIIVLTQLGRRDRHAADAAVNLAINIKADIQLINCFPITSAQTASEEYSGSLKALCEKEAERLRSIIEAKYNKDINIETNVIPGELGECVFQFIQGRNVAMVVMGGRQASNASDYYCTDVNDIIRKISSPVLIIPEPLD